MPNLALLSVREGGFMKKNKMWKTEDLEKKLIKGLRWPPEITYTWLLMDSVLFVNEYWVSNTWYWENQRKFILYYCRVLEKGTGIMMRFSKWIESYFLPLPPRKCRPIWSGVWGKLPDQGQATLTIEVGSLLRKEWIDFIWDVHLRKLCS